MDNVRELRDGLENMYWEICDIAAEDMSNAEVVRWWDENWMDLDMRPQDVDWYGYHLCNARNALEKLEEITNLEEVSELLEVA